MLLGYISRLSFFLALGEAQKINDKNTPFRDPAYDSQYGSQIGNGVYLVAKPGGWRETRGRTNYHCVFKADEDKFDDAAKAWVPSPYWDQGEASIAQYIRNFDEEPDETVRISYIDGYGEVLQMLIPTKMVNADTLDIFAKCFPSKAELIAYEAATVDWTDWNLYGEPGEPTW
ncbi:hypothetical protein C8035_v009272 [Colletotrichum spinosum]|uniref:Uncharacterized protein n=1 Tax=Colletotrichum spinosum TaxID=1347390 RepID=A0A4R8Q964_9PEZI|nr:hypothetical protein C8035_v009272 [Colletotrichum spinosum]